MLCRACDLPHQSPLTVAPPNTEFLQALSSVPVLLRVFMSTDTWEATPPNSCLVFSVVEGWNWLTKMILAGACRARSDGQRSLGCSCRCLQCLGEWAVLNEDIQLEVTPEGQEEKSFDHSWLFNKTDLADGPALIRSVYAQGTKASQRVVDCALVSPD